MNILDENIPKPQRLLLESRGIPVRQIGVGIGRKGMLDEEVIPLLQSLRRSTFFTRDVDFYKRNLAHSRYCLVIWRSRKRKSLYSCDAFCVILSSKRSHDEWERSFEFRALASRFGSDIN